MDRREFIRATAGNLAAYGLLSPFLPAAVQGAGARRGASPLTRKKPNIVIILADDLGYGEPGFQGGGDVPTPNIDSLAAGGVRFTNGYVSCPVCSPTRAGLMTGCYQQRFGHEFNPGPDNRSSAVFGLPLSEKTIADHLKSLGYATGLVGKWHLGFKENFTPTSRGFDEFFGFPGGGHPYFSRKGKAGSIYRGTEPVKEKEYLTDAFAREAVSFIKRRKDGPFFLYLAFNAVHSPLEATNERLKKYKSIKNTTRRTFCAMLDALDDGVGKTMRALRDLKLEDNTLIFFLSDNGGPTLLTTSGNGPLNGYKGQVYEGGIRVPFAAQWKTGLPSGMVYDRPVISLDILPTALGAAGGGAPSNIKLDGVSLLPFITSGRDGLPHENLFWRSGDQSAARSGDWKLVRLKSSSTMLFNLAEDIGEKNDIAAGNPDKLKELIAAYDAWNKQNIAPLWMQKSRGKKRRGKKR